MLPKNYRLNITKERFKRGDNQVSDKYFKIIVKKGRIVGPRIGFIVSSKVGNAVTRNKVRRSLSAAVEKNIEEIPSDIHLIFIAYPQSSSAKPVEINDSVSRALTKI